MSRPIYPWQEATWQAWQTLLAEQRLHHAMLYAAPTGSGAHSLGMLLAKTLLCRVSTTSPCDLCQSCQLVNAGTHPDFHHLRPEAGKMLSVDAVRSLTQSAITSSLLGGVRVMLIEQAHSMSESAANALLKTLEEPPANCYFILLTSDMSALLPTILSRCNQWKAGEIAQAQVQQWLSAEYQMQASIQPIRLYRGAPLAVKTFLEQGKGEVHQALITAFVTYVTQNIGLFSLVDKINAELPDSLNWLSLFLLDGLKIKQQLNADIVHCDMPGQLKQLSSLPDTQLLAQLRALNKLHATLTRHTGLNSPLLVSEWLTQFHYPARLPC